MHEHAITLLLIASVVAFCVLTATYILRRRSLSTMPGSFACALLLQAGTSKDTSRWTFGIARFHPYAIDFYRVNSMLLKPTKRWERKDIEFIERRATTEADCPLGLPDSLWVECTYRGQPLVFAMSRSAYNGFSSWLESAPPGQNTAIY